MNQELELMEARAVALTMQAQARTERAFGRFLFCCGLTIGAFVGAAITAFFLGKE